MKDCTRPNLDLRGVYGTRKLPASRYLKGLADRNVGINRPSHLKVPGLYSPS
jgi:hypothetical protein